MEAELRIFGEDRRRRCVRISPIGDGISEDPEFFFVTLTSDDPGVEIGTRSQGRITILDDDGKFFNFNWKSSLGGS